MARHLVHVVDHFLPELNVGVPESLILTGHRSGIRLHLHEQRSHLDDALLHLLYILLLHTTHLSAVLIVHHGTLHGAHRSTRYRLRAALG